MTVAALAEKSGLSREYVSKAENSQSTLPVSTFMTVARALSVNINEEFPEGAGHTRVAIVSKAERRTTFLPVPESLGSDG